MGIFQRPFSQKKGNQSQTSADDAAGSDAQVLDDVGTGGIQWVTERHVACVFLGSFQS